eukprot:TRINITY_DN72146_c0_g1_i1.p1 TRINITY_DN72146_c0_g1~~TRINITY_DN72146_c0_g1_i1.p1  ORF type:complete len:326 (+),score=64.24 TRINITY_DN72146_c0_g1_i1:131-1108(+)
MDASKAADAGTGGSPLLGRLPVDLLLGQLRACAARELAVLAGAARQPLVPAGEVASSDDPPPLLPLSAAVARAALGSSLAETLVPKRTAGATSATAEADVPPALWLRLYHYLCCARVECGRRSLRGHLCASRPRFVRCGAGRCEMMRGGLTIEIDVALVAPLATWRERLKDVKGQGRNGACCVALPLPEVWSVHANTPLEAVAPVTHGAQVCAVVPLRWGDGGSARGTRHADGEAADDCDDAEVLRDRGQLVQVASELNNRGECAAVRTHRTKMHLLSLAQIRMVSRSNYQPLLANVLGGFGAAMDAHLWAVVYTDSDPGFFCFG